MEIEEEKELKRENKGLDYFIIFRERKPCSLGALAQG